MWKMCCSMLQCVVLQRVAACCTVLQCVAVYLKRAVLIWNETSRCEKCVAVCCSVLCCSELQRVAAWTETSTCEIYDWNEWSKILRLRTKETYKCKKRPTRVKSDLHIKSDVETCCCSAWWKEPCPRTKRTSKWEKRTIYLKSDLRMWKVTYACEKWRWNVLLECIMDGSYAHEHKMPTLVFEWIHTLCNRYTTTRCPPLSKVTYTCEKWRLIVLSQ